MPYELERQFYEDNLKEIELALKEEKLSIAKNLLLIKVPLDQISQATGLPLSEIENL
jgi:hypothetical protein